MPGAESSLIGHWPTVTDALIRAARAALPKAGVIVCSGCGEAPEIGVDAFLAKPFSLEDLLRVLRPVP